MKVKKYIWLPVAIFLVGIAFYVYYGVTYNSWMVNLPNLLIFVVIIVALFFAQRKKEQLRRKREEWGKE